MRVIMRFWDEPMCRIGNDRWIQVVGIVGGNGGFLTVLVEDLQEYRKSTRTTLMLYSSSILL